MRTFYVHLNTISPLAVRADHAPFGTEMINYIPGSTFVGGLAAVHRSLYPAGKGEEFARFFLNTEVLYSDLYPANFEELAGAIDEPIHPLPRTAISCKHHPGFPSKWKPAEYHNVQDTLSSWAQFALSDEKEIGALENQKKCPICKESMDRFSGYYRRVSEPTLVREQADDGYTRLQTRTGINRETGTVEENILYNRMVFEEDAHFWGQITLPDDDDLYKAFDDFAYKISHNEAVVRLGTGRTRGLGKVSIAIEELNREDNEQQRLKQFHKRFIALNELIHTQIKDFPQFKNDFFFAVTLHSPLILRDELLRYHGSLSEQALNGVLEQEIPDLKLIYQSAGTKRVTGWYELWGTPRTDEFAIDAGSVFLFRCSGKPGEKALFQLEERGIGQRRIEGFGRICISDAFHSEKDDYHGRTENKR